MNLLKKIAADRSCCRLTIEGAALLFASGSMPRGYKAGFSKERRAAIGAKAAEFEWCALG